MSKHGREAQRDRKRERDRERERVRGGERGERGQIGRGRKEKLCLAARKCGISGAARINRLNQWRRVARTAQQHRATGVALWISPWLGLKANRFSGTSRELNRLT